MTDRKAMQQALDALEQSHTRAPFGADNVVYWEGVKIHEAAITALRERLAQPEHKPMHPTLQKMWEDYFDKCYKRKPEQEPVAWVYPEGVEALNAGKPWTAYGTRQEPNNIALYLSPQPDIPPYAWVTFTPYGDEDDVWYENPEGQLPEGWTYKPLYDTTPPQRKPLKLREIEKCIYDANNDPIVACRNVEAAHGIKENT